jgi:hypothetical protein
MIRNIKVLGLALVAVLAMSVVAVGSASAAEFTASSYPANGEGGQTTPHKFTVQGQAVECSTANFTGSLSAASGELNITPVYENCIAFGFLNATVSMNGCTYKFTAGTGSADNYTGGVHIVCPAGKSITVVAATCTVHIPAQTPTVNTVDFENKTATGDVLVTSTAEGIHSNPTSGFLCPLSEKATDTTGKYTGTTLFSETGGASIDVG